MHNKFAKGIASVLGAALILGSVVMSAVPANAATSTKVGDNYETTYTLADFELINQADSATITGNKIEWTNHWGNIFYKIPQEVIDAGVKGFYCKGTIEGAGSDVGVDLKIVNADDIWGTALVDKYTNTFDGAISEITADQQANATAFCIMSLGEENDSMSATVENVIFITEKSVGGDDSNTGSDKTDEPKNDDTKTDEPKNDDTKTDDSNNAPKTGESMNGMLVVSVLGGLLLITAGGMVLTRKRNNR